MSEWQRVPERPPETRCPCGRCGLVVGRESGWCHYCQAWEDEPDVIGRQFWRLGTDGEPVPCERGDLQQEGAPAREVIAQHAVDFPGHEQLAVLITRWTCLDYWPAADGPPMLWETLLFSEPEYLLYDNYGRRYASRADAIEGHAAAAAKLERVATRVVPR